MTGSIQKAFANFYAPLSKQILTMTLSPKGANNAPINALNALDHFPHNALFVHPDKSSGEPRAACNAHLLTMLTSQIKFVNSVLAAQLANTRPLMTTIVCRANSADTYKL